MIVRLHIGYTTRYGQEMNVILASKPSKKKKDPWLLKMNYDDNHTWWIEIDTADYKASSTLSYRYVLRDTSAPDLYDSSPNRIIHLKKIKHDIISVFDEWHPKEFHSGVFRSKPFSEVFVKHIRNNRKKKEKKFTHSFYVEAPYLQDGKTICILGAGKTLGNWSEKDAVEMQYKNGAWTLNLNLQKEKFPIEYKYVIRDHETGFLTQYEQGPNRVIYKEESKHEMRMYSAFPFFDQSVWRGTGINFPVSALRTNQSWGVGDFTDLTLMVDWAHQNGIRMIQLLPINDSIATHTVRDSYPYASISAYALHPQYLNVEKLANEVSFKIDKETYDEVQRLNSAKTLEHIDVAKLKLDTLRSIFQLSKDEFKDDLNFFEFFNMNREWLMPYAAFCYLRDLHNTADPALWPNYQIYNEDEIQDLVCPGTSYYDEIAFYYFIQYHLHLQLLDAVNYGHSKGVIFKGDLPIGVGRHSVETWVNPTLFHLDMQAGAPPDAFAVKGQNWDFPTYNWDEMLKDNYSWWRKRMEHMGTYFDAIRIDHVLGFFRIWSIPESVVEGILGVFVPSIPYSQEDLQKAGLTVPVSRLTDPYINDYLIEQSFGTDAEWARTHVINQGKLQPPFTSQKEALQYFNDHPEKKHLQQSVFDLVTDVVLIRDTDASDYFHFRIDMMSTRSYQSLEPAQQQILLKLYKEYFFGRQDEMWQKGGNNKLNSLQDNTTMLLCAEDLGMVPGFVDQVLSDRDILSLSVQRMPKKITDRFSNPAHASYLSVVTPSTHDTSTIRQWWEEDRNGIQEFYNHILGQYGVAPYYCEPWVATEIIKQHLHSPAMWAVFLMQDLLALDGDLRIENPNDERINIPSDPNHNWNYRMHITIETLLHADAFNSNLKHMIKNSGRS